MATCTPGCGLTELNPGLRLVLAIFNRRLGEHIRNALPRLHGLVRHGDVRAVVCRRRAGRRRPSHVRVQRRTLYVARPADVAPGAVICGLATPADDHEGPPAAAARHWGPRRPGARRRGRDAAQPADPRRNPARWLPPCLAKKVVWHKFGMVFTALLAVIGVGFGLLATRYSISNMVYLGIMDLTGSALTSPADSGPEKIARSCRPSTGWPSPGDNRDRRRCPADRAVRGRPGRPAVTYRRRRRRRHQRTAQLQPGVRGCPGQQARRRGFPFAPSSGCG